jgi:hypothetical protein
MAVCCLQGFAASRLPALDAVDRKFKRRLVNAELGYPG